MSACGPAEFLLSPFEDSSYSTFGKQRPGPCKRSWQRPCTRANACTAMRPADDLLVPEHASGFLPDDSLDATDLFLPELSGSLEVRPLAPGSPAPPRCSRSATHPTISVSSSPRPPNAPRPQTSSSFSSEASSRCAPALPCALDALCATRCARPGAPEPAHAYLVQPTRGPLLLPL